MADHELQGDAAELLGTMQRTPPREPGEALRSSGEARILEFASKGWTQGRIAAEVGCHQSTVNRTLAEYDDSRPMAVHYLRAKALDMTKRLVEDAKPETILRVLAKLDVVRDDKDGGEREPETHLCWPRTSTLAPRTSHLATQHLGGAIQVCGTDRFAAHCDAYSLACSKPSARHAHAIQGYLLVEPLAPSSLGMSPPNRSDTVRVMCAIGLRYPVLLIRIRTS